MRTAWLLLLGLPTFGCKDTEGGPDQGPVDNVDEADADADTDADADADSDADTDASCWVDGPHGPCFAAGDLDGDGAVECAFPTEPGPDSSRAFLNQCLDASISVAPFDNAARIPSSTWVPGDPLPPIP